MGSRIKSLIGQLLVRIFHQPAGQRRPPGGVNYDSALDRRDGQ